MWQYRGGVSRTVFFNLGFKKPRGSTNFLQGSVRMLKLALFWVSRFRQTLNIVSKVPRQQSDDSSGCKVFNFFSFSQYFLSQWKVWHNMTDGLWKSHVIYGRPLMQDYRKIHKLSIKMWQIKRACEPWLWCPLEISEVWCFFYPMKLSFCSIISSKLVFPITKT